MKISTIITLIGYIAVFLLWLFWPPKKCPRCGWRQHVDHDRSRLECLRCGCVFFKIDGR
jgi:hypothetical protein